MSALRSFGLFVLAVCLPGTSQTNVQRPCTASSIPIPVTKARVALTEVQEMDLGDAAAEHLERTYNVVHDDANEYLQQLGDRIVAELPPSGLRFRFTLVNLPSVNAFATPGGRVYVSRKLVAFANGEDELAGVLGHEIGHIITRQIAADLTEAFRQRLKVTDFGDRHDIFEKYHRLIDAPSVAARDSGHIEDEQYEADRVALLAVARAGFSPDAYVAFWDRFSGTNHNSGSFLSDLFAATRPESKRLREMLRSMEIVPAGCRAVTATSSDQFRQWQKRVIETTGGSEKTAMRAVLRERRLDPPLHSDINTLRFSPDGRFVLAQDDSSIYVLNRQPFTVLFRIDADDAWPAQFTPDSAKVVFSTYALRVERWDIASHARDGAFELVALQGAIESQLSADGRWLAYVDLAPAIGVFRIHLLEVETGSEVFKKEVSSVLGMFRVQASLLKSQDPDVFELAFSPDGRYFLAGANDHEVVVELSSKAEVKLPDSIRQALRQQFTFLGTDRLVTVDQKHSEQSAILRFPSGELLKKLPLGGRVTAATHGDALLLRPIKDWPVGLLDLAAGRVTLAAKTPALDAYDDARLSELPNGDVALFRAGRPEAEASVALPVSPLGTLKGASVSADLRRVALSGRDRGGVWDTTTGHRLVHVRGFTGADIEDESNLYADFPARKETRDGKPIAIERAIDRVDLATGSASDVLTVGEAVAELQSRYYATLTPEKPGELDRNVTFEVRDVAKTSPLWTRRFSSQPPWMFYDLASSRLIFEWDVASPDAKAQIKIDATLRSAAESPELKDGASLLEVIGLQDGKTLGRLLVATGRNAEQSARGYYIRKIQTVLSSDDAVVVLDKRNQAMVYSVATGKRLGTLFGRFATISERAGLIGLQNAAGVLQCYDSKTLEQKAELHLGSRIRMARFSADGRQLLLLTADQVVRLLDVDVLTSRDLAAK
jgi:hypothetical protein